MRSILTNDEKHCFICGGTKWLEMHHIFGGANRNNSTKFGLIVPLCHYCHNEPPNGVHHNQQRMLWLKQQGQIAFEQKNPELDFLSIFGKNYL